MRERWWREATRREFALKKESEDKTERGYILDRFERPARQRNIDPMSPENVVVVAVRAEREISKTALEWALTHVVRPGDLVTLLAVLSDHGARGGWRRRLLPWGFPRFGGGGDSGSRRHRERCQISAACSQMALQIDGRNEISMRIKVVGSESSGGAGFGGGGGGGGGGGMVATESKSVGANWIVLDKQLKQEIKPCMEELQCNIVVIGGSCAKVLRLNLGGAYEPLPPFSSACSPNCSEKFPNRQLKPIAIPDDVKTSFHKETREAGSSTGIGRASSIFVDEGNHNQKLEGVGSDDAGASDSDSGGVASPLSFHLGMDLLQAEARRESSSGFRPQRRSYPATASSVTAHNRGVYRIPQNHIAAEDAFIQSRKTHKTRPPPPSAKTLQEMFAESNRGGYAIGKAGLHPDLAAEDCYSTYGSDVREAVSLFGSCPSIPPPLCSLCRHKAPVFGKPPRRFAYRELEMATDGFSNENFVAEGAIGCVHRGVLEDGRVVAVKRLKPAGGSDVRGEDEFCEEVEVLSRAQHRNVVMLVGFCVEGKRRVLVYEYICNGSLDRHLYGRRKAPLDWHARIKIAVGVARGLRYLHEDCRVGFVVHKDMRPNNILLTHDYEPLVGDFSRSRWQTELSPLVDANVAETFGYLAPEYIEHGVATEKADVYAYGVVLLEMITGRRALDASQPKGQQFLVEWARPLVSRPSDEGAVGRFLDPRLDWDQARFFSRQLRSMARAASMCLRRDPQARPGMSKVLRILEGDAVVDPGFDIDSVGTRSGRMSCCPRILHQDNAMAASLSQRFAPEPVMRALRDQRSWPHFR